MLLHDLTNIPDSSGKQFQTPTQGHFQLQNTIFSDLHQIFTIRFGLTDMLFFF